MKQKLKITRDQIEQALGGKSACYLNKREQNFYGTAFLQQDEFKVSPDSIEVEVDVPVVIKTPLEIEKYVPLQILDNKIDSMKTDFDFVVRDLQKRIAALEHISGSTHGIGPMPEPNPIDLEAK